MEWRTRLECARQRIDGKRREHERRLAELAAQWDALVTPGSTGNGEPVLKALRDELAERSYITNLLATVERDLTSTAVNT